MALSAICTLSATAQKENPRGVYKLITLDGRVGLVNAPLDQYKICTDSVTLMLNIYQGDKFQIGRSDKEILNYTGERAEDENDHTTRIYDSNAEHFTLKWWSENPGHPFFPAKGWCTEFYEAGKYSPEAKPFFDMLMNPSITEMNNNPFLGTWRFLGYMDELRDTKKDVARMIEEYPHSKYRNWRFLVLQPEKYIGIVQQSSSMVGISGKADYEGKKLYKINGRDNAVKWLSKDIFASPFTTDYRTDYEIWQRVTDDTPLINYISSRLALTKTIAK